MDEPKVGDVIQCMSERDMDGRKIGPNDNWIDDFVVTGDNLDDARRLVQRVLQQPTGWGTYTPTVHYRIKRCGV